jgi:uncharacterized SAM-binding protein YcdF (DUF218 family)
MFIFLSKFLPNLVYPLSLAVMMLLAAWVFVRKPVWRTRLIAGAFLLLWLGGSDVVSTLLMQSLEWRYLPPVEQPDVDAIVVLGGGTDTADYPRSMVEINGSGDRVLYAAKLYQEGKAPVIFVSGGRIEWAREISSTPAGEMLELLQLMGVPAEDVVLQPESRNTYEDALYTSRLLREQGVEQILLVTSAFHMPRSVALFENQGIEVIAAPVDFKVTQIDRETLFRPSLEAALIGLFPSPDNLSLTTLAVKEYLGIFTYSLRGWLDFRTLYYVP